MREAPIDGAVKVPKYVGLTGLICVNPMTNESSGNKVSKLMSSNKVPSSRRNLASWESTVRPPGDLDQQREAQLGHPAIVGKYRRGCWPRVCDNLDQQVADQGEPSPCEILTKSRRLALAGRSDPSTGPVAGWHDRSPR